MPFDSLDSLTYPPLPEAPPASAPEDAKPFTLPHFVAWLRGRNLAERYNVLDAEDCILCRYGKECGAVAPKGLTTFLGVMPRLSPRLKEFEEIAYGSTPSFATVWQTVADARARAGWMGR